jgi:outer membrane protein
MFALTRTLGRSGGRLSVVALCLGLGLAGSAWAQDAPASPPVQLTPPPPPRGIGLGAILDMARSNDAQYAAAVATAEAGREKLPQARAANLPSINATYNPKRSNNRSSEYSGGRTFNANSAALTVTQALIRPANWAGTDQGELQVQLAEQQLQLAAQDLLLRVSRGYFDVLQAQDDLAAAVAQQDAMVQQLAQTKRALEVGTVPITDFNEAQGRHDIAVAQRIAAANELESRKRVLERYIAQPLPPLARLGASASVDLLTPEMQRQLVADASSNALQVQIGRTTSQVAEKEISRREAGHYPTLDLVGTVRDDRNQNYGQFGGSNTREASIGVELTVPIYQGGLVSSRTREAIADRNRALQELSNAQRQATLDAEQAQLGVQSGSALTQALKQALVSGETQLRSTQRGLQVGVRTRVDVLNAEQQLYATRKDLAAARYKTLVATLQLKAAAGILADTDLRALDALLTD